MLDGTAGTPGSTPWRQDDRALSASRLDEIDGYRRRGPAALAHDPRRPRHRVVRDQRMAGDRTRARRSSASTTSSAQGRAATRSSTSCSAAARRFTVDGEPVDAPAGIARLRPRSQRQAQRGRGRGGTTILVIGGRAGRPVRGLAVGALGRGAALLDDRRLGASRSRSLTRAARRAARTTPNVLYNLACAEVAGRHGTRLRSSHLNEAVDAGASLPGQRADRRGSRRRARRPALPHAGQVTRCHTPGPPPDVGRVVLRASESLWRHR